MTVALAQSAGEPTSVTTLVVALKTVTLVLGGLITFFALKAYRRTHSPALRALTIGFGAVTLGSMVAGVLDRLLLTSTEFALVTESALTAVGFAVILYSLYVD
ncbi:DUF7521 family protein [Halorussus litoreus]|uniref:DUF7521 family protein n=1 Tax=Halorussus litoreus TaxID=1710536 RepID=UPI001E5F9F27|nr:hypothetical protein [Halorussus litoreus]